MNSLIKLPTRTVTVSFKSLFFAALLLVASNVLVYLLLTTHTLNSGNKALKQRLYLLDQAATFVYDIDNFETKVRSVSKNLSIPPEWLMAVMHSES